MAMTKERLAELQLMGTFHRSYDGIKKNADNAAEQRESAGRRKEEEKEEEKAKREREESIKRAEEDSDDEEEEKSYHRKQAIHKKIENTLNLADKALTLANQYVPGMTKPIAENVLVDYLKEEKHKSDKASSTPRERVIRAAPFLKPAIDAFVDFSDAISDLIEGRRPKTGMAVIGGILVGAAIGAVLGTLVFPGIGSAAGFVVVGGTIALVALGAVIGGWIGKRLGGWIDNTFGTTWFKNEKYQLRREQPAKIFQALGLNEEAAERINAYLRNRFTTTLDSTRRTRYLNIRIGIIRTPTEQGLKDAIRFFIHEAISLQKEECPPGVNKEAWENDREKELKAVFLILEAFTEENVIRCSNISADAVEYLKQAIKDHNIDRKEEQLLKEHFPSSEDDLKISSFAAPPTFRAAFSSFSSSSSSSAPPSEDRKNIFREEIFKIHDEDGIFKKLKSSKTQNILKRYNHYSTEVVSDGITLTFLIENHQVKIHIEKKEGGMLHFSTESDLTQTDSALVRKYMQDALADPEIASNVRIIPISSNKKSSL